MSCKLVRTAKALTRSELIGRGVIDKFNKILNLPEYRRLNTLYSETAQSKYGVGERLLLEDDDKAIFNVEAFYRIDAKKEIFYKENEYLKPGPEITDPILNQIGQKEITPEVKQRLRDFLTKINPDFTVEVLDNLSVNGLTNLNEFLIQLRTGREGALFEETAHVFVEMLDKNSFLFKELNDKIMYTKMYTKVVEEYGEHPEYKGNFPKLRREAIAKLISLELQNPELAEYYIGGKELVSVIRKLFKKFLEFLKGKGNPFERSAIRILELNQKDLLYQNAMDAEVMYQLNANDLNPRYFQTLKKNIDNYDKVYLNINDSILNYKEFKGRSVGDKNEKYVKARMFTQTELRDELNNYYNTSQLTKLGHELKDKISEVGTSKFVFYTDAPVTQALVDRIRSEFGNVSVVRTGYITVQSGVDIDGNQIDQEVIGSDKSQYLLEQVKQYPNANILVVDNRRSNVYSLDIRGLETTLYTNDRVTYTDQKTLIMQKQYEEDQKLFSEGVLAEFKRLDKTNVVNLAKDATTLIRNIVGRIESAEKGDKFEELSDIFKDEFGNLTIPIDRAKQIYHQLQDNSKEFELGLLNFIKSVGSTTLFWKTANANNFKSLRNLANSDNKEDINKAIKEAAVLMRFALGWRDWIQSIDSVLSDPSMQNTSIIKGVISELRNEVITAKDRIEKIAVNLLSKQFADVGKDYNAGKKKALDMGLINKEEYDRSIITPQSIANIIFGFEGDIAKSSYFENAMFVNDEVLQSISILIEKGIIGANQKSLGETIDLTNKINKIQSDLGMSNEEIGKKITYVDKESVWEDGVMIAKDSLFFLNPFKNRHEYKLKRREVELLKEELSEANREGNQAIIKLKQDAYTLGFKNFKQWERENWNKEQFTEPWEIYQNFGLVGEDLERAEEYQQTLWAERRSLIAELRSTKAVEEEELLQKEINLITNRIKNLRSSFDVINNREKIVSDIPEEDIRIAKVLKEKHIIDRQLYEYKVNEAKFKKDLVDQIGFISNEGTKRLLLSKTNNLKDLYNTAKGIAPQSFIDWIERNMRVIYTQDFYDTRSDIIKKITALSLEMTQYLDQAQQAEIVDINSEIQNRWELLMNLSSSLRDENGIFDASDASLDQQKMVRNAEVEIEQLKQFLSDLRDTKGLDEIKREIGTLIEQLINLQSKNPTNYYQQTMYEKLTDIFPKDLGGVYEGDQFERLINTDEFTQWRLTSPQEFQNWFTANHLVKMRYDSESRTKSPYWAPTYVWMKIEPTADEHVQVIPGYKYSDREYKDFATIEYNGVEKDYQLITVKTENTWDQVLKEWLPKSSAYRNEEYFRLKNTANTQEQQLFTYLSLLTTHHLKIQEDANRDGKLGFKVPTLHKRYTEGGALNTLWKQFVEKVNPIEEGESNLTDPTKKSLTDRVRAFIGLETPEQEAKKIKTDLLGNPIQKLFVPYTGYLEPENTTRDTLVAVVNYGEGLERVKSLVENIPELNLLEQLLERFQPFEKGVLNQRGDRVPTKSNRRLDIVRNMKRVKLYGDVKDFELGKNVDRITLALRHYTTFFSQSILNPANAFKNYIQGQLTNIISGNVVDWATPKTIAKAMKDSKTSYAMFLNELTKQNRSLDFQLITIFNPMLSRQINELFTGSAFKRNATDINKMLYLSSEAGEFGVLTTLLYSHLYHKNITLNGVSKKLYDVFELKEGKIGLKENAYDGERLIDQDYLNDLILKTKVIMEQVQGKQWNPTVAQRYTLWRNIEFFKKYFIPKIRERFVGKRKNFSLGEDVEGFYVTFFRMFMREVYFLLNEHRFTQFSTNPAEARAARLMAKELVTMIITYFLISFLFGYDDDDDDKFKKLKDKSWVENFSLLILLNAKRETDSVSIIPFFNIEENFTPPLFNETYNFIKQPFIGFGLYDTGRKILDSGFAALIGSESAIYDTNQPNYFIEKGDYKVEHYLTKLGPWDDLLYLANPERKVFVSQQAQNR